VFFCSHKSYIQYQLRINMCTFFPLVFHHVLYRLLSNVSQTVQGKSSPRIVRVGHPARLLPSVLQNSLDAKIESADGTEIVRDVKVRFFQ